MRGLRHKSILLAAAIIAIALLLSGCTKTCTPQKTIEKKALTKTVENYAQEPYTITENKVVGQKCIDRQYSELNNTLFKITTTEKEWITVPPQPGKTNQVRRIATIFNGGNKVDSVYLDKIYLYNGTEIKRSKHPMMFLVDPQSTRTLYVVWDTQYDYYKDVTVDFSNNTAETGVEITTMRLCYNETKQINTTQYKKVVTGTTDQVTGYSNTVKVKLGRDC